MVTVSSRAALGISETTVLARVQNANSRRELAARGFDLTYTYQLLSKTISVLAIIR